jgi:hypothetical protein
MSNSVPDSITVSFDGLSVHVPFVNTPTSSESCTSFISSSA